MQRPFTKSLWKKNTQRTFFALLLPAALLCSCKTTEPQKDVVKSRVKKPVFSLDDPVERLHILHSSDNESALLPRNGAGGIDRFLHVSRGLTRSNTLALSAGDTFMPGPTLSVEIEGKSAALYANNLIRYRASALGNHEFDLGVSFLDSAVKNANFPYIASTLEFDGGELAGRFKRLTFKDPAPWAERNPGFILPRAKTCTGRLQSDRCDGLIVGIVGTTTEDLRRVSRPSALTTTASTLDDVKVLVQAQVNALRSEGVNVIVMLSHLQDVSKELTLIERGLVGVDIIIAGGGDDRLANTGDRLLGKDTASARCQNFPDECFPIVRIAQDNAPVIVSATDGQYRYLGELDIGFDKEGVITDFDRKFTRPVPIDDISTAAITLERSSPAIEERVESALKPRMKVLADSQHYLEGRREFVRNRETNLGNLSGDAMLHSAQSRGIVQVKFAMRNSGGIRAPIGAVDQADFSLSGTPITELALESAFKFDGELVVVTLTHQGLREAFERAFVGAGTARGHFPQVSENVVVEYSENATEQRERRGPGSEVSLSCVGERVRSLTITTAKGDIEIVRKGKVIDADKEISFITLKYLAEGGDGYFPGRTDALKPGLVDAHTKVTEKSAVVEFILHQLQEKSWNKGERYIDPLPQTPASFKRIKKVDETVYGGCRN